MILSLIVITETWLLFKKKPVTPPDITVINTADSIVSSVQDVHVKHDSIVLEILKTDTLIEYVREQARQNHTAIANYSIEQDVRFFTNYIYMCGE